LQRIERTLLCFWIEANGKNLLTRCDVPLRKEALFVKTRWRVDWS
jgi:hypothetical protein